MRIERIADKAIVDRIIVDYSSKLKKRNESLVVRHSLLNWYNIVGETTEH